MIDKRAKRKPSQTNATAYEPVVYFLLLVLGLLLRWICANSVGSELKKYAHFNTPMTDPRELRELFYIYEKTGEFYAGPNTVAQSELYLKILYTVNQISLEQGGFDLIYIFVGLFEALSIVCQLIIFHLVFSATEKKADQAGFVLCWIVFNPLQVLGSFANFGSLSDCLFYVLIMLPMLEDEQTRYRSTTCILNVILSYFDPRLLLLLVPITVIQSRF